MALVLVSVSLRDFGVLSRHPICAPNTTHFLTLRMLSLFRSIVGKSNAFLPSGTSSVFYPPRRGLPITLMGNICKKPNSTYSMDLHCWSLIC
jgi:hypothetical protein